MRKIILALLWLLSLPTLAGADVYHVVMLDQSGSMAPFYQHPGRRLHTFLRALLAERDVVRAGDGLSVLQFSIARTLPGFPAPALPSPQTAFSGSGAELRGTWQEVERRLQAVPQWTDLVHGLEEGVRALRRQPGTGTRILWFLTDIVSAQSDPSEWQTAREFYDVLLRRVEFQSLSEIHVFAIDLEHPDVQNFEAQKGLMLYTMLWLPPGTPEPVGRASREDYQRIVAQVARLGLPELMGQPPLQVRPLPAIPLQLELVSFTPPSGPPIAIPRGSRMVELPRHLYHEGEPIRGTLQVRATSAYDALRLPSVHYGASLGTPLTADFLPVITGRQKVTPEISHPVAARAQDSFEIALELPPLRASYNVKSVLTGLWGVVEADLEIVAQLPQEAAVEPDLSRIAHERFKPLTDHLNLLAENITVLPVTVTVTLRFPVEYTQERFWVALAVLVVLVLVVAGSLSLLWSLLSRRTEWDLIPPDGDPTRLHFRPSWPRAHRVIYKDELLGWLVRMAGDRLRFDPAAGGEGAVLESGGIFMVGDHIFRVEKVEVHREEEVGDESLGNAAPKLPSAAAFSGPGPRRPGGGAELEALVCRQLPGIARRPDPCHHRLSLLAAAFPPPGSGTLPWILFPAVGAGRRFPSGLRLLGGPGAGCSGVRRRGSLGADSGGRAGCSPPHDLR